MRRAENKSVLLAVAGFAAGFVNGLLGAGGGIITVFAFGGIFRARPGEDAAEGAVPDLRRDAFANTIALMLPLSVISALSYAAQGIMPGDGLNILVLPAVAGGVVGGILLDRLNANWLKLIFSLLVIYSGVTMFLK